MLTRFLHIPTPPGSAHRALSFLRTETAFQAVPVFRMAYFLQTAHCAVCRKTLMLQVRFAHPPSAHRNAPSGHSGVPMGGGSFALPLLRTEPALRAAPVFRSAYFPIPHRPTFGAPVFRSAYSASRNARASAAFAASIKPHRALFSKTLDLQPLRGLRWAGEASLPPCCAPTHLWCAGVPPGLLASPNAPAPAASRPSVGGGSFAPPCTPLSHHPRTAGRTDSFVMSATTD